MFKNKLLLNESTRVTLDVDLLSSSSSSSFFLLPSFSKKKTLKELQNSFYKDRYYLSLSKSHRRRCLTVSKKEGLEVASASRSPPPPPPPPPLSPSPSSSPSRRQRAPPW